MAKEKIFRETPFNGYNRDDVMAYIAEIDKKNTELRAADVQEKNSLAADLEAKTQEVEKLNGVIDSLNFAVEEKAAAYDELAKEFEAYKAENESKASSRLYFRGTVCRYFLTFPFPYAKIIVVRRLVFCASLCGNSKKILHRANRK